MWRKLAVIKRTKYIMKYIIFFACVLMSGCQAFVYSSAPPVPLSSDESPLNVAISVNESQVKIKGFELVGYLKQRNVFKEIIKKSDEKNESDLFLVVKLESDSTGSRQLELLSVLTSLSTLYVIPGAAGKGFSLRYYLIDGRGQVVTSYVYQKNATVVTGLLVPPLDGMTDERNRAATGDTFGAVFAKEGADRFIHFLQEDRSWLEHVYRRREQKNEYDKIFEQLGVVVSS